MTRIVRVCDFREILTMGATVNTARHQAITIKVRLQIPSIRYGWGPVSFWWKHSMNSGHSNSLTTTRRSVTIFYIYNISSTMDAVGYYIHIYMVALIPILRITFWPISAIMGSNIM